MAAWDHKEATCLQWMPGLPGHCCLCQYMSDWDGVPEEMNADYKQLPADLTQTDHISPTKLFLG